MPGPGDQAARITRRVWRNGPRRWGALGAREARTQGASIVVPIGATEDEASRRISVIQRLRLVTSSPPMGGVARRGYERILSAAGEVVVREWRRRRRLAGRIGGHLRRVFRRSLVPS